MDDPLSLRGVIDINQIESILRSFSERVAAQEVAISSLVAGQTGDVTALDTMKSGIDRALDAIDHRFTQLEARLHGVASYNSRLTNAQRGIDELAREIKSKVNQSSLTDTTEMLKGDVAAIQRSLERCLSDHETISRLDHGQRHLAKQLSAIQELITCKVDRVEIPLIQNAGERVQAAEDFRVVAGPRLDKIESALEHISVELQSKEERSAIVERMQAIHKEFKKRPDSDYLERQLEVPLDELRKHVEIIQCDISLIQPQNVAEELHQLRSDLNQASEGLSITKSQIDRIEAQMVSRASMKLVEKKADKEYCEQLVHELSLNCHDRLSQNRSVVDSVKKQILELKRIQNEVDRKLGISMKFLDWFTTVQLEKRIHSNFM